LGSDGAVSNQLKSYLKGKVMKKKEMTLADHAKAWWKEQGHTIPEKETEEWDEMYGKWVNYAFAITNLK